MPPKPHDHIDIIAEVGAIQEERRKRMVNHLICALILGTTGVGKSTLAKTCRRPVHIDSFDPDGTVPLRKEIEEGWIIADTRYELEDPRDPSAFELWDTEYNRRKDGGYFEQMGTYVLDGLTMWSQAIMNLVLKGLVRKADRASAHTDKSGKRVTAINTEYLVVPQENDWPLQMNIISNALHDIITLPCDVIVIGHTEDKKDREGNLVSKGLYITGKLMTRLPRLFEEIYVMKRSVLSKGSDFKLCTARTEGIDARTRIGGGIFDNEEKPDIFYLLKKAGLDPQHKEMPWMEVALKGEK